jgi:hypothetical protein
MELQGEIYSETGKEVHEILGVSFHYSPDDVLNFNYPSAPVDAVLFAFTHVDCHYAFLTDFSTVAHLDEAPVVLFEPMGDDLSVIVADDILDFLRLLITVKSIFGLYTNEDVVATEVSPEEQWALDRIQETFQLQPFASVREYKEGLFARRTSSIAIRTSNELGVIPLSEPWAAGMLSPADMDWNWIGLSDVEAVFRSEAHLEYKLACLREIQEQGEMYHEGLIEFLGAEMEMLGFVNESEKLKSYIEARDSYRKATNYGLSFDYSIRFDEES